MEERIEIALMYKSSLLSMDKVLHTVGIAPSTFYYQFTQAGVNPKGRKRSEYTYKKTGERVRNEQVVREIESELSKEFVDYGYLKTTYLLRDDYQYVINAKKVYRLMKENGLVYKSSRLTSDIKRQWVKDLVPQPDRDFSYLEFDIKYFYVQGARRNAMILTVIDVKSRWVLAHYIAWSIKQNDVKRLFKKLFVSYELPDKIYVRSDNGSQFVAQSVQQFFADIKTHQVVQEYIKPASPNQNAHIESYHSIAEKVVCQMYTFQNIQELKEVMERFKNFYNFRRIHSGVGYKSPYKYLLQQGVDMKIDPSEKSFRVSLTKVN